MSLRKLIYSQEKHFVKGGKLERLEPLYEMAASFIYPPLIESTGKTHVRDALELKRMMTTVVIALIPAILFMLYNTGLQANVAIETLTAAGKSIDFSWHQKVLSIIGVSFNSASILSNMIHGLIYFLPIYIVTIAAGGFLELLFAIIRKHQITESFFVTSMLFPMILPATTPLWQVAIAVLFGVFFGKELFGGTGRNIVNPALFARAFLFFAYPASASGDSIWYPIDAGSGATPLALAKAGKEITISLWDAFIGFMPGSMGETSVLACLIGAAILIFTGIASMRIMVSAVVGLVSIVLLANIFTDGSNPFFALGPIWHLMLGGFAFGVVFMATDPVSASMTDVGKCIYGFLIGALTALVRLVNPAYPEGVMLAILFCNILAPTIDYVLIKRNIKRREVRCAN